MSLLLPVQRAAQTRLWLKAIVETGEISLDATRCASFLKDASTIESAGFVVRMPASWRMSRLPRP